ncbi:MAG TPA: adenylate/guanylate cyclase domain-containing protein, partial [Actinomycetota bacterium]|nr:adenylate/guanylate cyclase domain-containing protein [Actinomycetota bacterium]
DAGLALGLAVAIIIAIEVAAASEGVEPAPGARAFGLIMAALVMVRRRRSLGVLLASAVALQLYGLTNYPGIFPAVPLSVAVATAWAAGHRRWTLAVVAWFVVVPFAYLLYQLEAETEPLMPLLNGTVQSAAMFAAVLILGEAMRNRRALDRANRLLQAEQDRSEQLLRNVLPGPIADRLKRGEKVIADGFPEVTVLFADLVDFTRRSHGSSPERVVRVLDDLFSALDRLAERHGLEKIKTIGDAYMVVGGLPEPRPDHAQAVAEMALAVCEEVPRHRDPDGRPLAVRVGIDTGPVVAGVIGRRKFSYDLWGDTVNTASRMESRGVAGCIQVTERTYRRLRDRYHLERRGPIQVKGKGTLVTWFLVARG